MTINPYYFVGKNPTVDLLVFNHENKILMVLRSDKAPACAGQWALPGGFIDTKSKKGMQWNDDVETAEAAALRELQEETNLTLKPGDIEIIKIGIYEGGGRDPRDNAISWSQSSAFACRIPQAIYEAQKANIMGLDGEASDVQWKSLDEIKNLKIAFDHSKIIQDGLEVLSYASNKKLKL